MKPILARRALLAGLALPALLGARPASAWRPERTVRIVVPYTPGNITDIAARLLAQALQEKTGQTFVVENRAGAGTVIGTEVVARSPGDGTTLLLTGVPFATNPGLLPRLPYDSAKDLAPVVLVVTNPLVLVAHPSAPYPDVAAFIARAKREPGAVQVGSGGNGTLPHMATELLAAGIGTELTHVPYRGGGAAAADLVAGNLPTMFDNPSSAMPHIQAGRMRPLAVTSARRSPVLPQVPTVAEAANLPGFEAMNWFGLFAPGTTPPALLDEIHAAFAQEIRSERLVQRFAADGVATDGGPRAEFAAMVRAETEKWGRTIRERGIKAE